MNKTNDGSMKWIAYELHDGLLPWIHGALMQMESLDVSPESESPVNVARDYLRRAMNEGRTLIGYLEGSSEDLPSASLADGIRQFVSQVEPLLAWQNQTLTIDSDFDDLAEWDTAQSWSILRILQQAVVNANQHAGPTAIQVQWKRVGERLVLEIIDQGSGFDVHDHGNQNRVGLTSMKQRALSIGAELEIDSQIGSGTTIRLIVPAR